MCGKDPTCRLFRLKAKPMKANCSSHYAAYHRAVGRLNGYPQSAGSIAAKAHYWIAMKPMQVAKLSFPIAMQIFWNKVIKFIYLAVR